MVRIRVFKAALYLISIYCFSGTFFPVEALFVQDNPEVEKAEIAQRQAAERYEARLGFASSEENAAPAPVNLGVSPLPSDVQSARMEMIREREAILKRVKAKKEEENRQVQAEVAALEQEFERIKLHKESSDPLRKSRGLFAFQIFFLFLCVLILFPFTYKGGKLLKFLDE